MKRIIISCALLVFVFGVASSAHAVKLTRTFNDPEYGYSISHPSTWRAKTYRSGVILSEVNHMDGRSGLQIRFLRSGKGLQSYIQSYIMRFRKDMKAELISKSRITIDGKNGYEMTFKSGRKGSSNYFLKSYVFESNKGGFYAFQCGTPFSLKNKIEPVLDGIAYSFQSN